MDGKDILKAVYRSILATRISKGVDDCFLCQESGNEQEQEAKDVVLEIIKRKLKCNAKCDECTYAVNKISDLFKLAKKER